MCYLTFLGYLWKDKSEDGVRKILQDNVIPLDRLLVETDAPFMYPNTRASKLPQNVKDALTERFVLRILPQTLTKPQENAKQILLLTINSTGNLFAIPRSVTFLQRYCTFQRNEPCSLPVTVEMISVSMTY